VVKAALRSVHGERKIANAVSGYYLAGHLARTYDGRIIAIPEDEWSRLQRMSTERFIQTLQQLATKVDLAKFQKHKRRPKKPRQKRYLISGSDASYWTSTEARALNKKAGLV
jgi:hypothetical protein